MYHDNFVHFVKKKITKENVNQSSEELSVQKERMNMPDSELWDSYFFIFFFLESRYQTNINIKIFFSLMYCLVP